MSWGRLLHIIFARDGFSGVWHSLQAYPARLPAWKLLTSTIAEAMGSASCTHQWFAAALFLSPASVLSSAGERLGHCSAEFRQSLLPIVRSDSASTFAESNEN